MKSLYLYDILKNIDGSLIKGNTNTLIEHVATKRKKIKDHTLFFHLSRIKYIHFEYFQKNKPVVVVTENPDGFKKIGNDVMIVKVINIDEAYEKFIDFYRNLFNIPVIGITGTCGKTTVKEMVKHILSTQYKVHATYMSDNSNFHNLRYLLGMDDETEAAVFEMPVASPNYLRNSCKYFQPGIRILLNIGVYHLTGCKTPKAYMKAKAEILEGLDPVKGTLILNADDENIKKIDVSQFENVIYFGMDNNAHFRASKLRYGKSGMNFVLRYGEEKYPVFVHGYGEHNVYNALAALAAVSRVGMDLKQAIDALATFKQVTEHLEVRTGIKGCTVLDDTWNNSPLSMNSALKVLKDISCRRKTIALLGYMPQLGEDDYAKEEYARIGEKVVETKVDLLVVVGEQAQEIGIRALELGMDKRKVHFSNDGKEIAKIIRPFLKKDGIVLLKIPHRMMVESSFVELKNNLIS